MQHSDLSMSLHKGLEQCDVSTMLSLYDDNAEIDIIDRNHTPSNPWRLMGKKDLEKYFNDVLSRPVKHHIDDEVMSGDRYAYTDTCEYPDGTKVFTSAMAILKDGKIVREVDAQAWDYGNG